MIELFVAILNFLLSWTGWKIEIECKSWIENIMGWIRKATTIYDVHTYTLEYSIVPLNPVATSMSVKELQLHDKALYLSFDFSIPEIEELLGHKTEAIGFVGFSDFGVALSENLLNKIINAWWIYSPVPRTITTNYSARSFYANLDLNNPQMILQSNNVWFNITASGEVGTNLGPVHDTLESPTGLTANILLFLEGRSLVFKIDYMRFRGDNTLTGLANYVADYAYNFTTSGKQLINKKTVMIDIASSLRFDVEGTEHELKPTEPVQINPTELLMKFSTDITPSIRVDPDTLNFFREGDQTVKLRNIGNKMLEVKELTIDDNLFSIVNPPGVPLQLPPNEYVTITIHINPSWTELHIGKLNIRNNDPANSVAQVALIAQDKPIIEVTTFYTGIFSGDPFWAPATWLGFDQYNGSKEIFIRNKGHGNLIVKNISIENRFFSSDGLPSPEVAFTAVTLSPFTTSPGVGEVVEMRLTIKIDVTKLQSSGSFGYGTVEDGKLKIESEDEENPIFITSLHAQYLAASGSQK